MPQVAAVSERALLARINRVLAKDGEVLRKAKTPRMEQAVGLFYAVDINRNVVTAQQVDLDEWARDLGCMREGEQIHED